MEGFTGAHDSSLRLQPWASFAATLALLAYTATAVVSACTAVDYLDQVHTRDTWSAVALTGGLKVCLGVWQVAHTGLPPVLATLCLLGVLALLRVTGIRATAIFSQVHTSSAHPPSLPPHTSTFSSFLECYYQ